jgi:hypothetical protein
LAALSTGGAWMAIFSAPSWIFKILSRLDRGVRWTLTVRPCWLSLMVSTGKI